MKIYYYSHKNGQPLIYKGKEMNFENRLKSVVLTNHNDSRYSYINYFKKVMSGDTNFDS